MLEVNHKSRSVPRAHAAQVALLLDVRLDVRDEELVAEDADARRVVQRRDRAHRVRRRRAPARAQPLHGRVRHDVLQLLRLQVGGEAEDSGEATGRV